MFTCTKLSRGESLLSFYYSDKLTAAGGTVPVTAKGGLQAQPVRRDELQHPLTGEIPLWFHRRVTLDSFTRMKTLFTYLNQTLLHKLFLFPVSFMLLFSSPTSNILHTACVSATLWHEQSHGLPVQEFQSDAMVSVTALMSKFICKRKGVPLQGLKAAPHQKQDQG